MRLVPQGEVGELIVAGRNLATGYIRDNESRKFQDNPYAIDLGKNFHQASQFTVDSCIFKL